MSGRLEDSHEGIGSMELDTGQIHVSAVLSVASEYL
jgi:hypothetical protein